MINDEEYESLIDQAVEHMDNQRFKQAWECIVEIPDAVKINDFAEECALFANIAMLNQRFDEFLVYYTTYFHTIDKADNDFVDELTGLFFDMTTLFDSRIYPYVYSVIELVIAKFRTPGVLHICGSVYDMLKLPEKGLPLLDEALDIDPFNKKLWWEKVFCYHEMGDTEKELECCNYYMALEPECSSFVIVSPIAKVLAEAKRYDEALELLSRSVSSKEEMNENKAFACSLIADIHKKMNDQPNELKYRKLSIKYEPDNVDYTMLLVQYYISTELKPEKAEKIMLGLKERNENDPAVAYMLASLECQLYIMTHKPKKLENAKRCVLKLMRENKREIGEVFSLASRIYLLDEDYKTGLSYAKKAYKHDPNNRHNIMYMVLGFYGCGQMTEFRRFYRIFAKIDPDARNIVTTIHPDADDEIAKMERYDKRQEDKRKREDL